ncbi:MAG: hypothetical protein R3288_02315 [Woeseiaceae bacterium]|nr:hypothetical protein [Woeseiaceae bacterium]
MLEFFGETARFVHVGFGAVGLAAFWIPVFVRKGGRLHVRAGKVFVWSAYVVLATAAIALTIRLAVMATAGTGPADAPGVYAFLVFLGYLTYVTFVIVRHGMNVLRHKRDLSRLKTPLNRALAIGSIAASLFIVGYALIFSPPLSVLLFALSPIGVLTGGGMLRYMGGAESSPRGWMYEHLGAMLGAGIAFHTAFAVFGATRLFDIGLSGWVAVIPWIAPTLVGVPATIVWTRYYRRKFGELA